MVVRLIYDFMFCYPLFLLLPFFFFALSRYVRSPIYKISIPMKQSSRPGLVQPGIFWALVESGLGADMLFPARVPLARSINCCWQTMVSVIG